MTKQLQLIELYCTICHHYNTNLVMTVQRLSNNFCPKFTDEECLTIYIWGITQQKYEVKAIYEFIKDYYHDWFPYLPSYQAFNKRVCYLADAFYALADLLLAKCPSDITVKTHLLDSMPIIVANSKRSSSANVASELCNKGYCGSKDMYYYGVKLHVLAKSQYKTLPMPQLMCITKASENDMPVAKRMLDDIHNIEVFADKMYKDREWEGYIKDKNNIIIRTPVKLSKGQKRLTGADQLFSTAVSKVRQPIESFFSWLQEKTHIQRASKVRSADGLTAFIFARIASICLLF